MRVRAAVIVAFLTVGVAACSGTKNAEPPASTVSVTVPKLETEDTGESGDLATGPGYAPGIVTNSTVAGGGMRDRSTLSAKCNQALAPAREVLQLIKSGRSPGGAEGTKLAESMRAAERACTPDEYVVFQTKELEPALAGG